MKRVSPGYGETPLPLDDVAYLQPEVRSQIEAPVLREAIDYLEATVQDRAVEALSAQVLVNELSVHDVLDVHFLKRLHHELFHEIWSWAGIYRLTETNIGVPPEKIATEVQFTLDNLLYRWQNTRDWSAREFGIAVHAELVRIHPFTDGNGRSTRILAGLVFASLQDAPEVQQYDWDVDKPTYIQLLKQFEINRDPKPLAEFIPLLNSGE